MKETSKSIPRRLADSRFATRYFVGHGIDVGAGDDPLEAYRSLFPLMKSCRPFDRLDGDAQAVGSCMDTLAAYDFLYSSHCLEHLQSPAEAMTNWCQAVRSGGHLVVMVPDEDMYEQGVFPSRFNGDHKWTFTLHKSANGRRESWCSRSLNITSLIREVANLAECLSVQKLDATYMPHLTGVDQTLGIGECAIEMILRVC